MDSPYERLSIRDSVRSLKKYGSTSKHVNKNQKFVKHTVAKTDTLQGLALKYEVTTEDIRRANRMYTSDSLFLKEYLLIPVADDSPFAAFSESQSEIKSPPSEASSSSSRPPSVSSPCGYIDNDDVSHFLSKIDSSIANTKAEVRKSSGHSDFTDTSFDVEFERRKAPVSRMRRSVNNNSNCSVDSFDLPKTVVTSGGKKLQRSLQRLEQEQDEFFEL